jgi:formylglycine-generating enzyme required for sulfatase activity
MRNYFPLFLILVFACLAYPQAPTSETPGQNPVAEAVEAETLVPSPPPPGMVTVPTGEFWMGRVHFFVVDAIGWFERDRMDNTPAHRVTLDAFYMDRNEVANEDYLRFADETGRSRPWQWPKGEIPGGDKTIPVYNVSWEDADAYCSWSGKRLPTEAEWEKAARGGHDRKRFSWGDEGMGLEGYEVNDDSVAAKTGKRAHTNYPFGPTAVGSYPSNEYGLNDMSGNVWEWVDDWYYRNYYSISPLENPPGPETGKYKIIRGGGWSDSDDRNLMNHFRSYADPEVKSTTVGFRCAQSVPVQ